MEKIKFKEDERVKKESFFNKALSRPELGSGSGLVLVFIIFLLTAYDSGMFSAEGTLSWSRVAAQLAIISVGASLLMIGGEFDLSIGSMIGFAGMMLAILIVHFNISPPLAILTTFIACMFLGFITGSIVVKTQLPSFIVSLAFLFILRGFVIALSRITTGKTLVGGIHDFTENDFVASLFGGEAGQGLMIWLAEIGVLSVYPDGGPAVTGIPAIIVWAIGLTIVASIILTKTAYGNWIFAVGGDSNAARNSGVPVKFVKVSLFVFTAFCATVFATCQVLEFGSADAQRGLLKEFEAIIAAVIGGTLLTGGYGSVIGAFLGAIIFGVVQLGIFYTGVDSDWFRVFLGIVLLMAVLFNNYIRKKVTGDK